MGVGIDADTESITRGSIPGSGDAGRLCDGGFKNTFQGVWVYRPTALITTALVAGGRIIHLKSGAREVLLGFTGGAFPDEAFLQVIFNSGGGAGSSQTFGSHDGFAFADEWVYYFIFDNATDGQVAGYMPLSDLTPVTITRANDNATSQFITNLTFGNDNTNSICVGGYYAYARARFASGITLADVEDYAMTDLESAAGDWGFWPLDDNTDTGDDSGNSRSMTFNGTLTSEISPDLGGEEPPLSPIIGRRIYVMP